MRSGNQSTSAQSALANVLTVPLVAVQTISADPRFLNPLRKVAIQDDAEGAHTIQPGVARRALLAPMSDVRTRGIPDNAGAIPQD